MFPKCIIYLQAPPIGTFGSPNIAVGTSIGDRAAPGAAMVGLVGVGSFLMGSPDNKRKFYCTIFHF